MAFAGLWAILRDVFGIIPSLVATLPIPGISFGIQASPMRFSVGFLVGGRSIAWWMVGAVLGSFGIIVGGTAAGLWDLGTAQGIVSSLGMGLMMGSGIGVVVRDILPAAFRSAHNGRRDDDRANAPARAFGKLDRSVLALLVAAAALLVCLVLGLSPIACAVVVVLAFVTTIMSAQSVGQTGIDPMEIFGLIVLLVIAALGESDQVRLFFVAGVVAVACGLAGDVMSDFKTGKIIGTDPRAMWIGQAIGALIGCAVSVAVMCALLNAYGADAFGPGKLFVSAQASVVATMVSGIPSVSAFVLGLVAGVALYCLGIPSMMLGLGVYLPFYMTLSASLGAAVKIAYDRVASIRNARANGDATTNANTGTDETSHEETGIIVASGVLGGESIVGVIIALASVASGLLG